MTNLQASLQIHGYKLFYEFLIAFRCESYNVYEDPTGVRIIVIYRPVDVADKNEYEYISTNEGFVRYRIFSASIQRLTQDFERFIKLKAFL